MAIACRREPVQTGGSKLPFDRITDLNVFVACTYDVDLRTIRGEASALRLVADVRERVKAGRALRPDAAHYVNVMVSDASDDVARSIVLSRLGHNDGIDSVAVSGLSYPFDARRADAGGLQSALVAEAGTDLEPGWARLAKAIEADSPIVAKVVALEGADARVDVEGAAGTLWMKEGEHPVRVGDEVRVRVVMLNVAQRRAGFVRVAE
jgi:hypothetical protein